MFWKYAANLQENTHAKVWLQKNFIEITLRHGRSASAWAFCFLLIRTPMELVKNSCRKVFYTKYVLKNSSTARQTYNYNKRGFCYRCFCTQSTYIRTTLMSWCGVFANFEHILQIFAHIVVWYFLESIFPRTPMDLRATAS